MSLTPSKTIKQTLRNELIDARIALSEEFRAEADKVIATHVEQWLQTHPTETLGVFWPIRGEPNLLALYETLVAEGIRLSMPIVVDKNAPLQFALWTPGEELKKDALGVPVPEKLTIGSTPQTVLVPCVGFNDEHYRLGYGGGFYDRTLKIEPVPQTIGIAYACQKTAFEPGNLDVSMDQIITENGLL